MRAPELERRRRAAEATLARVDGKPFVWGTRDCVRVASRHLRELGCRVSLLKGRRYTTALGARRTLRALGFPSLAAGVDSLGFPRIPPAAALIGDQVGLPGAAWAEGEAGSEDDVALCVALGNGRVLTAMEGRWGAAQPSAWVAAWRVL